LADAHPVRKAAGDRRMDPINEIRKDKSNQDQIHHASEQVQKQDKENEYHASFYGGKMKKLF
jgi:hypothetical protein